MIFESETCLYVSLNPKPAIHEKKFLNLSKWKIFFNSLHFSGKIAFLQILFFHLKALQTRMQIDVNNFFVAQVVPEIFAKNTS